MTLTAVDNDWWPRFSDGEYRRRYRVMQDGMRKRGIDILLIHGTAIFFGSDPGAPNLAYLAAYAPGCQGYVVLPVDEEPTLLVFAPGHSDNAREFSVINDVRAGNDLMSLALERIREVGHPIDTLGIVGNFGWAKSSIPYEHYVSLQESLIGTRLEIVTGWYEDLRLLKSAEELEFMEAGARFTDEAHRALRDMVEPGVTDISLHNKVLRLVHELGGRIPFGHVGSTSMIAPTLSYPNFYPSNRTIQRGDVVLTEISAGYGGYFGKIYGTLTVGPPTRRFKEMLTVAAEIYEQTRNSMNQGMATNDSDAHLRLGWVDTVYQSWSFICGWSTYNTRPAQNRVASPPDREMRLRAGHCLNLTGWVRDKASAGGVWLGDTIVMTEDGARRLHDYPVTDLDYSIV